MPTTETVVDLDVGNGSCALGVDYDFESDFDWLLGDAFLRSWCHVFDVSFLNSMSTFALLAQWK